MMAALPYGLPPVPAGSAHPFTERPTASTPKTHVVSLNKSLLCLTASQPKPDAKGACRRQQRWTTHLTSSPTR